MILREEQIGDCRLILGDCLSVFPSEIFDACITDPPYGIQADKAKAHSSIRDNPSWGNPSWDLERPQPFVFGKMLGCSKYQIIWGGNYFTDYLPVSPGWLSWRKPEAETGFSLGDVELAWTNLPIAPRQKTVVRRDGNVHPTQKPLKLMQWCIDMLPEHKSIIDPFMGSGTTGVAAVTRGKSFVGIEVNPEYFVIACERIHKAYNQPDLFIRRDDPGEQESIQETLAL